MDKIHLNGSHNTDQSCHTLHIFHNLLSHEDSDNFSHDNLYK